LSAKVGESGIGFVLTENQVAHQGLEFIRRKLLFAIGPSLRWIMMF
jgi:hypothetical protein